MRTWKALLLSVALAGCSRVALAAPVSTAIAHELDTSLEVTTDPVVRAEVARLYQRTENRPIWIVNASFAGAARAVALLNSARAHGLEPEWYGTRDLERRIGDATASGRSALTDQAIAALDVSASTAVLTMGRDAAIGRTDPARIVGWWRSRRQLPDLAGSLAASTTDLNAWIRSIQPHHPEYEALRRALVATLARSDSAATSAAREREQRQLALNLERWRWMPDDLGERYVMVNIPSFNLRISDHGADVATMRVIVGKPNGHETPIFSDVMETVVFSPYWNVPAGIALKETAPAAARDGSYLARNNMELFRRTKNGNVRIAPGNVNWSNSAEVRQLAIRQRPGRRNALGTVKFLFPNDFSVYLHDTPSVALFKRDVRALSHGCVRIAEPAVLARYVLRDDPSWNDAQIAAARAAGVERHVKLGVTLPVHIVYFTAWIGEDGVAKFARDIYGYDAKQIRLSAKDS